MRLFIYLGILLGSCTLLSTPSLAGLTVYDREAIRDCQEKVGIFSVGKYMGMMVHRAPPNGPVVATAVDEKDMHWVVDGTTTSGGSWSGTVSLYFSKYKEFDISNRKWVEVGSGKWEGINDGTEYITCKMDYANSGGKGPYFSYMIGHIVPLDRRDYTPVHAFEELEKRNEPRDPEPMTTCGMADRQVLDNTTAKGPPSADQIKAVIQRIYCVNLTHGNDTTRVVEKVKSLSCQLYDKNGASKSTVADGEFYKCSYSYIDHNEATNNSEDESGNGILVKRDGRWDFFFVRQ